MEIDAIEVSDLTRLVKQTIEQKEPLQDIWVRGEISNFNHHSRGHMYFTLKDDHSRIRSLMFKGNNQFLKFTPQDGMKVLVRGQVNVYERDGQYQLYAREMQPDGIGALYQAYEQLKAKLNERGWFANDHKQKIPAIPARIGVVTSPTGAAVRDILITLKRRYPVAEVYVFPVLVQGEQAPTSIVKAIGQCHELDPPLDVIIVGRGGGSIEELWAFNEEMVAEAIYQAKIPIISAVGHETDTTIADFVADLRAATPTAAAELAAPVLADLRELLNRSTLHMNQSLNRMIKDHSQLLKRLRSSYAFKYPEQLLLQKEQQLDQRLNQLIKMMNQRIHTDKQKLELHYKQTKKNNPQTMIVQKQQAHQHLKTQLIKEMKQTILTQEQKWTILSSQLDALSPLKTMTKGYSLIYNKENNQLLTSVGHIQPGQTVNVKMHDGQLDCQVWGIEEDHKADGKQ